MTARSRHTENSAFVRDEAPSSRGIITKGQRRGEEKDREKERDQRREGARGREGESKKASLVGAPSAVRRLQRRGGGGGEKTRWPEEVRPRESERSDETKEEGRPMLGDKSRLTSRERGL